METYSIPFPSDLHLDGYLRKHENFIGRQWLYDELKEKLQELEFSQKGIVLTADIGYGKSAIVSKLLCSKEVSFHNDVLAYHVCRFDVLSTKNPALFIRRMIGMIANQLPEFGSRVSLLPNKSLIFDKYLCEQDPNLCFDQGLQFPLRELHMTRESKQIIVIDALDECSDGLRGSNKIADLIRQRAHELPSWIVFLITSRNTADAKLSSNILNKHIFSNDTRNHKDINTFVERMKETDIFNLKTAFNMHSNTDLTNRITELSGGNFLYLTHAIPYWLSIKGRIKEGDLPSSLDRIYEINFERMFGREKEDYKIAKLILEIVGSSFYPLKKDDVLHILQTNNATFVTKLQFDQTINQLALLLKTENEILVFTHISIRHWLTGSVHENFPFSVKNGATLLSEYFLHSLQVTNGTFNFTQLVLQISISNDAIIEEKFRALTQNRTKEILEKRTLHEIVALVDSPKAINLIAHHYTNLNERNENNLTASCIAALTGHSESFKRLVELGADVHYTVQNIIDERIYYFHAETIIDFLKVKRLTGYNLLHIAAQSGQTDIVDFILSKDKSLLQSRNYFGHLPMHVACEFGRTNVLQRLFLNANIKPDLTCLYLASKNQHENVVELVLGNEQFTYRCISDKEANHTFHKIRTSKEKGGKIKFSNELVRPLDVWWKIRQDSPLHVAVRKGNLAIARMIASIVPSALDCVNGGGFTPFLASVKHDQTDIYKEFFMNRSGDVCFGPSQLHAFLELTYGIQIQTSCLKGMTLTHLLASDGQDDMVVIASNMGYKFAFEIQDTNSLTPLHYAACNGKQVFLITAYNYGANLLISSSNGSTPYHSAAVCNSCVGLYGLSLIQNIPFVEDYFGMSIGLYLMLSPVENTIFYFENEEAEVRLFLLQLLSNTTQRFLSDKDNEKRNIVHLALKNGHSQCIKYLLTEKTHLSLKLLNQADVYGQTPAANAIRHIHEWEVDSPFLFRVPRKCAFYDLFKSASCLEETVLDLLMSQKELSLLHVMMQLSKTAATRIYEKHFKDLIIQSKMYLVPFYLTNLVTYSDVSLLKKHVYDAMTNPQPNNVLTIAVLSPHLIFHCDSNFSESPLHALADKMDAILRTLDNNANTLIQQIVKTKAQRYLLVNCLDQRGRNVLQRAIKEGSFTFAKLLNEKYKRQINSTDVLHTVLDETLKYAAHSGPIKTLIQARQNISLNMFSIRDGTEIVMLGIESEIEPCFRNKDAPSYLEASGGWPVGKITVIDKVQQSSIDVNTTSLYQDSKREVGNSKICVNTKPCSALTHDEFGSDIINSYKENLNFNAFCSEKGNALSPIHLLAASNMFRVISSLLKLAPLSIINCENKDGVTPLYLARIFGASETVQEISKFTNFSMLPDESFERILILKLVSNFVDSNINHPLFYLQQFVPNFRLFSQYETQKTLKVLRHSIKRSKLFKTKCSKFVPSNIKVIRFLRHIISLTDAALYRTNASMSTRQLKLLNIYGELLLNISQSPCLPKDMGAVIMTPKSCKLSRLLDSFKKTWTIYTNKQSTKSLHECLSLLRQFSKAFITIEMQTLHEIVFSFAIKEASMLSFVKDQFFVRETIYHPLQRRFTCFSSENYKLYELAKFRYIDILKGVFIKRFRFTTFRPAYLKLH